MREFSLFLDAHSCFKDVSTLRAIYSQKIFWSWASPRGKRRLMSHVILSSRLEEGFVTVMNVLVSSLRESCTFGYICAVWLWWLRKQERLEGRAGRFTAFVLVQRGRSGNLPQYFKPMAFYFNNYLEFRDTEKRGGKKEGKNGRRETERKRKKVSVPLSLIYSPSACHIRDWNRMKSKVPNSIWGPVDSRVPSIWAIIFYLPGYLLASSWIGRTRTQAQALWQEMWATQVVL